MVEIVWEFVVREEARGQFELAYGPGGAWSRLFARCPGFRGLTLLRDVRNPRRYLAIELWETEAQREQALAEARAGYAELNAALADWSESRTELGAFRVLAEATVRPPGGAGRSKAVEAGRRDHRAGAVEKYPKGFAETGHFW
ncbi:MAG: antibiotic biosynthesis monooxygenase [Anaerolineae bacterium]|nr:antibiotic biosynthesis monooxygenase [Anaerolineae bacterium]